MKNKLVILLKKIGPLKFLVSSGIGAILVFFIIVDNLPAISKPQEKIFFNGRDLTGWSSSNESLWKVEDGAIVGRSDAVVSENEFIWSDVEVKNFYLSVDILLNPADRNAGIQFRSVKVDERVRQKDTRLMLDKVSGESYITNMVESI